MSALEELPAHLLDPILAWYKDQHKIPEGREYRLPASFDSCRSSQRNLHSKIDYDESSKSLRRAKKLRHSLRFISTQVDAGIARMERNLRHASRYHGIRSLPAEVMLLIINYAALNEKDPARCAKMMCKLLTVPPFDRYAHDCAMLVKRLDRVFIGRLKHAHPNAAQHVQRLTTVHLTTATTTTLAQFLRNLAQLHALQDLSICCWFDYPGIVNNSLGVDVGITLQSLKSLTISNLKQKRRIEDMLDHRTWSAVEPLRLIIARMQMPMLEHITASIYGEPLTLEERQTYPRPDDLAESRALCNVFAFKTRVYPKVRSLDIAEAHICNLWSHRQGQPEGCIDLWPALLSLPSMTYLRLGSCQSIRYFLSRFHYGLPHIRSVKLSRDGRRRSLEVSAGSDFLRELKVGDIAPDDLCSVWMKERFCDARWVSDVSILEPLDSPK